MIYESGELFCPKCNESGMGEYTNWTSRVVFYGEKKIRQFIFYKKTSLKLNKYGWIMCNIIEPIFCCDPDKSPCCSIIGILIYGLFYIALCFWVIDIICYFFCQKKEEEEYGCWWNTGKHHTMVYCSKGKDIWEKEEISNKGLTKGYWDKKNKNEKLFQCSKCFYNPNSFIPFIKRNEKYSLKVSDSKTTNDTLKVSESKNTNPIAINILSNNGYFPILCYPNDLLKNVLNKFFQENPEYNFDNCYFLGHGTILQPKLTISNNGIKNGENIQLILNNTDDNDPNNTNFDEYNNDYQAYYDTSD